MTEKALQTIDALPSAFDLAKESTFNYGQVIIQQYAKAEAFYMLMEGQVSFYLSLDGIGQELNVGKTTEELTPIGWSGFSLPQRFATTVKASSPLVKVYRWDIYELTDWLQTHKDDAIDFLQIICQESWNLVKETINVLSRYSVNLIQYESSSINEEFQSTETPEEEDVVQFLIRSPFFEVFDEGSLKFIAQYIERRQYRTGDYVYEQEKDSDGTYLLASGKVTFSFIDDSKSQMSFRTIITPGFMVGWSAAMNRPNIISAIAAQESIIYFIPNTCIQELVACNPAFANTFYQRLLWLIGHQLQAIRTRLISVKFNREVIAIRNLIEHNSTKLDLNSNLHKVPHLLENKLTIRDGLQLLKQIKINGSTLERNLSALCLDLVNELQKEHRFYKKLVRVYQSVVQADAYISPSGVRKICAEAFTEAWEGVPTIIRGLENLPEKTGHIFIYNHLSNHPYNTLPNNFQVTLDSHFISSMILFKRYKDPGIRIVRIGKGAEYGHQDYYQRLGHIDVYTRDSDPTDSEENKKLARRAFYEKASDYLYNGINLIISPEGTSYPTDSSPGAFKSGAFRLALSMEREPLIVPISIANFDKRIRNNIFSFIIHKPFKVSEFVKDPNDKKSMKHFLEDYQVRYRKYVEEAIELSKKPKI
ncbi:MAG: cyclic nucleotide-binding domain-containing protein [Bacteroidota bacterium]